MTRPVERTDFLIQIRFELDPDDPGHFFRGIVFSAMAGQSDGFASSDGRIQAVDVTMPVMKREGNIVDYSSFRSNFDDES